MVSFRIRLRIFKIGIDLCAEIKFSAADARPFCLRLYDTSIVVNENTIDTIEMLVRGRLQLSKTNFSRFGLGRVRLSEFSG